MCVGSCVRYERRVPLPRLCRGDEKRKNAMRNSISINSSSMRVMEAVTSDRGAQRGALYSLYKFTRPHTMLGTFISVLSVSMLGLSPFSLTYQAVQSIFQALTSALLMNICIVGINQVSIGSCVLVVAPAPAVCR